MTLTRREFLQMTGITAASASLFGIALPPPSAHAAPEIIQGRTLIPTTLHTPSGDEHPLWADTILHIHEHSADHYATDAGLVPRVHVQPMTPYIPQLEPPRTVPFYAEVAAPAAAIREYADGRAPLNARVGHGGVMRVTERIESRSGVYYAVSDANNTRQGWSPAVRWRALPERQPVRARQHITLNRTDSTLTAYADDAPVFTTAAALPETLQAGRYTLRYQAAGAQTHGSFVGVPYCFALDDAAALHGVYWHNRFGVNHTGSAVELNVLAAKWLYVWAGDEVAVRVV